MKTRFNWTKGTAGNGTKVEFFPDDASRFTLSGGQEELTLSIKQFPKMRVTDKIILDIHNPQMTSDSIFLRFLTAGERRMQFQLALFPAFSARVLFRVKWLDGQLLFPPVNPGTLKSCMSGDGIRVEEITEIQFVLRQGYEKERRFEVLSSFVTDEEVGFPMSGGKTVDELGQWKQKQWPGKLRGIEDMRRSWQESKQGLTGKLPEGHSRYGGRMDKRFAATGNFRTEKEGGRWYLVDPDGCAFYSTGVYGVYPGEQGWIRGVEDQFEFMPDSEGEFAPAFETVNHLELYRRKFEGMFPPDTKVFAPATANLIRMLGKGWYDEWADVTIVRLRAWGFNTLSTFCDPEFIRRSQFPYVYMLKGYPVTKKTVFREFPDVYSKEYDDLCKAFASQLEAFRNDPCLIGYFLNNEPTWAFVDGVNLAAKLLETGEHTDSLDRLIEYLRELYGGDVSALGKAWNLALPSFDDLRKPIFRAEDLSPASKADLLEFTSRMMELYAKIPSEYAKKVLPNHLNLGMRFAHMNNEGLIRATKYFDVHSFNCYRASPLEVMKELAGRIDKPLMVTEFHFGALDAGLPCPSLFWVESQRARGEAYTRYVQDAASHPYSVGTHYFAYNDQPVWGRYDAENYQFGCVDVCQQPHEDFVKLVAETNHSLYQIARGEREGLGGETKILLSYS